MTSSDLLVMDQKLPVSDSTASVPDDLQQPADDSTVELKAQIKVLQERLEEAEAALKRLQDSSAHDLNTISMQREKIMELEGIISKQKMTISNQSKAISQPPKMGVSMPQYLQTPSHLAPAASAMHAPASSCSPASHSHQPEALHNPVNTFFTVNKALEMSDCKTRNKSSHACVICHPVNSETNTWMLSVKFQNLFSRSYIFGQTYTNFPSIRCDSQLGSEIKEYLMTISDKLHASTLTGNPTTRFCMVAKAINVYLVHKILQITVAEGFDAAMDSKIAKFQECLGPDTVPAVRHLLLTAIAHQVQAAVEKPDFARFIHNKVCSHTERLWQLIHSFTQDPLYQSAWTDLAGIITEAHTLAIEMFSLPLEYDLEFPAVNTGFNPTNMVNCDMFIGGDPEQLKNNTCVRLGITPMVKIRDNSTAPPEIRVAGFASVLLRPPPRRHTQLITQHSLKGDRTEAFLVSEGMDAKQKKTDRKDKGKEVKK
ncbi:hypothetical protein BDV25DRAFT_140819 [Aspergillus avenaceus]|uniref:Uncharacterized protein n=1 Tax=Aspergillus avenaceus TaxID=36643 RepID=A0A5N6TTJ7_ASPAV|nr:hypothetical protein BDV25DRAFT_140819 [Aspergillus avenaceus]